MQKTGKILGWTYVGIALIFFLGFSYREIQEHGWATYFRTEKVKRFSIRPKYRSVTIDACLWRSAIWPYYLLVAGLSEE
jgi:hypothetical protein